MKLHIISLLAISLIGCTFYGKSIPEQVEFEHGLRHQVIIPGDKEQRMILADRMKFYKVPAVSIAMIDRGNIAWAQAYGAISFDASKQSVDTQTLFQAASISKLLTAIGALLLVQQGKLSLDKNVNTYLTSWKIPDNECTQTEKVTLRQLLSHTAGVSPSDFDGYAVGACVPTLREVLEGKKPQVNSDPVRVTQVPGKEYRYSGGGITIVQLLIEDVTGEKFDEWMKKNILIPFGMSSSTFDQPLAKNNHTAYGHYKDGTSVAGKWHIYPEHASAGLWSTPTDLAQFAVTLCNILHGKRHGPLHKELLQEALKIHVTTDGDDGRGLGFVVKGSGKNMNFSHSGNNEGFNANLVVYPELQKGWIIMVNNDGAWDLVREIEHSIADVYGIPGKEPLVKHVVQFDEATAYTYAGTYKYKDHILTIQVRENQLFLVDSWILNEMRLYYAGNNTFFTKEKSASLRFSDATDHMNTLTLLDKYGKTLVDETRNNEMIFKH